MDRADTALPGFIKAAVYFLIGRAALSASGTGTARAGHLQDTRWTFDANE